jgi:hypothetical protein
VHELASYAGVFGDAGYGELRVGAGAAGLSVRIGEVEFDTSHRSLDTWDLRYDPLEVDAALTFATDADGAVSWATLRFDGEGPVVFTRVPSGE